MSIELILRQQDGLITRAQAVAAGLSKAMIERRLGRGEWHRVRPRVFLAADHEFTARARVRAVLLWLGDEAVLVGAAAAWWWPMTVDPPPTIRVAVGGARRVRGGHDVVPERRDVSARDTVVVDGVRVLRRAAAVVDAARELGFAAGAELVDRALLRHGVTPQSLRTAYCEVIGRHGSGRVARLVGLAERGARSEAERIMHRLLRDAAVLGWIADHRVVLPRWGPVVLDIAFPAARLVIEVDGWAYHRDLPAFRRDHRRQNGLVVAGWTVLRFSWHDLVARPDEVLATIRRALADHDRDARSALLV